MKKLYIVVLALVLNTSYALAIDPGESLVDAAAEGSLAKVKSALQSGAKVNYYDPSVTVVKNVYDSSLNLFTQKRL